MNHEFVQWKAVMYIQTQHWASKNLLLEYCCRSRTADGVSVGSVLHTSSFRCERAFENPVCPFVLLIKKYKNKYNAFTNYVTWVPRKNCTRLKHTQPYVHSCTGKLTSEKLPFGHVKNHNDAFKPKHMNLTEWRKWDIKFHITNTIWKYGRKVSIGWFISTYWQSDITDKCRSNRLMLDLIANGPDVQCFNEKCKYF